MGSATPAEMSLVHESAWLETLLRKVSHDNSISKIVKVTKQDIGVKGDNYASRVTRVTLELILNSGRKSKKTLIVKSPLDLSLPLPLFKLEIKIYAHILSEFNALMNEFQDPNEPVWCEMIGYQPYNIIILEDLKATNFKVVNRRNCLDVNHALLVLNGLGRLHGMSYKLLKRGTISPEDFGAHMMSFGNPFAKRMVEGGFDQLACVMEKHWGPEWNCLDVNHALLVLNGLGRLHGMSYKLLKRGTISPEDFGAHLMSYGNPFAKRMIEGGFDQLACVMEKYWGSEWKDAAQRVAKLSKVIMEKIHNITQYPKDSFLVMNHGDTWTCNMMFKYCPYDENIPIAVRMFDLPFACINSYILDVVHFVYLCTRSEVRRENLDKFYRAYQKSLESTLEFYGEPGVAPTLEQIYAEAKRAEYFGMFFSACLYAAFTCKASDSFSFEKCLSTCPAKDSYNPEVFKEERYRKSIEPDIKRWLQEGLL